MTNESQGEFLGSVEEHLLIHGIKPDDLENVRKFGAAIGDRMPEYIRHFYAWLETRPDYREYFHDGDLLGRVQSSQIDHWQSFFDARVDEAYVATRVQLGEAHARIGLPLPSYFAGVSQSFVIFTEKLYEGGLSPEEHAASMISIVKLLNLDTTIVVDTFSKFVAEQLAEQSMALAEMSTPVTAIWDDILMLPIVGIIDSNRAQDVMAAVLAKIMETRAKVFIMDISGVAVVDTAVANHLIKITKTTKLMGCECMISGLSPAIAQTIVDLGIETGDVRTTTTLRDALEVGFATIGVSVSRA